MLFVVVDEVGESTISPPAAEEGKEEERKEVAGEERANWSESREMEEGRRGPGQDCRVISPKMYEDERERERTTSHITTTINKEPHYREPHHGETRKIPETKQANKNEREKNPDPNVENYVRRRGKQNPGKTKPSQERERGT